MQYVKDLTTYEDSGKSYLVLKDCDFFDSRKKENENIGNLKQCNRTEIIDFRTFCTVSL